MLNSTVRTVKYLVLLLILPLLLVGCFDFVEEVDLKKDGSGAVKYKLNLSQSKTKLSSIMLMDSIRGYAVPSREKIHQKLEDLKSELAGQKGLHNVRTSENWADFIFKIEFDFDSIGAINAGLKQLTDKDEMAKKYFYEPFKLSGNKFIRNYKSQNLSELGNMRATNTDVLQEAGYVGIYRFEKSVSSQVNSNYSISKSGKAVMFKSTFLDLIDNNVTLQNSITLR